MENKNYHQLTAEALGVEPQTLQYLGIPVLNELLDSLSRGDRNLEVPEGFDFSDGSLDRICRVVLGGILETRQRKAGKWVT